jgi:hypothetical protein
MHVWFALVKENFVFEAWFIAVAGAVRIEKGTPFLYMNPQDLQDHWELPWLNPLHDPSA